MCSTCFPRPSLPTDASLSSTGSSGASSPASSVLSKRYDFLPLIPPRFVAFAWRYLSVHSLFSLPGGRVSRRGLELVTRYLHPVGSKNSAELEVVLSTAVAARWSSTFQLPDFTHCASESGRLSCPRLSFPCNSCSSPATFC
jgi:hypothetical protein